MDWLQWLSSYYTFDQRLVSIGAKMNKSFKRILFYSSEEKDSQLKR